MVNFKLEKGKPYPLGASLQKDGVQFVFACESKDAGLILKNKKTKEKINIPFSDEYKSGNIGSILIKYLDADKYLYKFYDNGKEITDPFSKRITGNEKFGFKKEGYELFSNIEDAESYDWSGDCKLSTSFEDTVVYLLHVRGFTAHPSSKVANKGTVSGICQKIDYLKDLGITAIELMPSYEFEEYEIKDTSIIDINSKADISGEVRLNYWGYKKGFYFAPKASYCATNDPVKEYKDFVKLLHKNGIEVYMQFYFPDSVKEYLIYDCLRFWAINYHIDGFHLKGNKIPFAFIANDPLFKDLKLFYDYIPENEIYDAAFVPENKNLCVYSDAFMYQMRKVLKGDEDTLKDLVYFSKLSPQKSASLNFITNYYGFTLNDLVSYDRKHNEDNGEKNSDGCDYNFSWNCGIEGKTKKASIVKLRKKMMKNALFLVFSSEGTPLIYAGDEICNTQNGNNNPYCQDNSVSYINWNMTADATEMLEYTKNLIKLRKNDFNKILNREFSMLDRERIGFPDLSYHSDEAWRADLATYNRHLGIMYSDYSKKTSKITLYYIAYNFYWKDITFSLPFIPAKSEWDLVFSTALPKKVSKEDESNAKGEKFELEARSCAVFKVSFEKAPSKN